MSKSAQMFSEASRPSYPNRTFRDDGDGAYASQSINAESISLIGSGGKSKSFVAWPSQSSLRIRSTWRLIAYRSFIIRSFVCQGHLTVLLIRRAHYTSGSPPSFCSRARRQRITLLMGASHEFRVTRLETVSDGVCVPTRFVISNHLLVHF